MFANPASGLQYSINDVCYMYVLRGQSQIDILESAQSLIRLLRRK